MKALYITSAETFSGKSALCIGLGLRFKQDGLNAGYMKPVNFNCQVKEGVAHDEDVFFAKQVYGMAEPTELISPVALTPAKLEQQLRGPETDYQPKLMDAFARHGARGRREGDRRLLERGNQHVEQAGVLRAGRGREDDRFLVIGKRALEWENNGAPCQDTRQEPDEEEPEHARTTSAPRDCAAAEHFHI